MRYFRSYSILFLLLLTVLAACAPTEPRILSANLGTQVQSSKITDPKTTFVPGDRMIHLVVELENLVGTTNVGAKWYSVGSPDKLLFESDLNLDAFTNSADFTITSSSDWIPGNYKVIVYLNGKEDRTLNFVVQ